MGIVWKILLSGKSVTTFWENKKQEGTKGTSPSKVWPLSSSNKPSGRSLYSCSLERVTSPDLLGRFCVQPASTGPWACAGSGFGALVQRELNLSQFSGLFAVQSCAT